MNQPINLGASIDAIKTAEQELGIEFPGTLKEIWLTKNGGLEIPPDWEIYPVFDPLNPRKTANSIVYENTPGKGRWGFDVMPADLIAIGANGTGNHLVLRVANGLVLPEIMNWNHETGKVRKWSRSLDHILVIAKTHVVIIEKARVKATSKRS
ncbi:MAG: SMI1/KNR4 family protein [Armatimonadota bacterium]